MRTSDIVAGMGLLALAIGLSPAVSFDGARMPDESMLSVPVPGSDLNGAANSLGNASPLAAVPVPQFTLPARPGTPSSPQEALRSGTQALRQGKIDQALV